VVLCLTITSCATVPTVIYVKPKKVLPKCEVVTVPTFPEYDKTKNIYSSTNLNVLIESMILYKKYVKLLRVELQCYKDFFIEPIKEEE
jgi:hypothetical protein